MVMLQVHNYVLILLVIKVVYISETKAVIFFYGLVAVLYCVFF